MERITVPITTGIVNQEGQLNTLIKESARIQEIVQGFSQASGFSIILYAPTEGPITTAIAEDDNIHPKVLTTITKHLPPDGDPKYAEGNPWEIDLTEPAATLLIHPIKFETLSLATIAIITSSIASYSTPPEATSQKSNGEQGNQATYPFIPGQIHTVTKERARKALKSLARLIKHTLEEQISYRRHLSTLTSLYEIGRAVSTTSNLENVLHDVLDKAITLLEAREGSLMMLDEVQSELKLLIAQGVEDSVLTSTKVSLNHDIAHWVAQQGVPRLIPEAPSNTPSGSSEVNTTICVPLKIQDKCLGVINLQGHNRGRCFSKDDLKVLTIFATHAASAIHNAQLYSKVKRQLSELEALHKIGHQLNSTLSLEEILPEVLNRALQLLRAEAASIMLLDEQRRELRIRVAVGLSDEVIATTKVKLGERVSGRVAASGKPTLISADSGADKDAALCVPLIAQDKVIGVLNVRARQDGSDFNIEDLNLACRLASIAAISIENAALHKELRLLFVNSIGALANAIDARDSCTAGHSKRVTDYAVMLAEAMGITGQDLEDIRYASLLHDIGKIKIRDHILNKPGRLTPDEYVEMKRHPEYGVEIMRPVTAFHKILPYMLHHHERFDGQGYPAGIRGEDIPLAARIMCVADCFDAMTSNRPYRKGIPAQDAVKELQHNAGTQFDPEVVDTFLQLFSQGRIHPILGRYETENTPSSHTTPLKQPGTAPYSKKYDTQRGYNGRTSSFNVGLNQYRNSNIRAGQETH